MAGEAAAPGPGQLQQRRARGARAGSIPGALDKRCWPRPESLESQSLESLVGPRDPPGAAPSCRSDKSTQTPLSWPEGDLGTAGSGSHRRCLSWGSSECCQEDSPAGFLSPCPTLGFSPCFHRSLEGLSPELEEAFVQDPEEEELLRILDVPDGHRAPVPAPGSSLDASLDTSLSLEQGAGSCSLSLSPALQSPGAPEPKEKEEMSPSPVPAFASSPHPCHGCVFQREPPEGCERVRAWGEAPIPSPSQHSQPCCPDRNKVHFSPSGSAFCPVSLGKQLFPAVEFLLRGFPAPSPFPGLRQDSAEPFGAVSKAPGRNCEPWNCGQPEDGVVFQSSLVA